MSKEKPIEKASTLNEVLERLKAKLSKEGFDQTMESRSGTPINLPEIAVHRHEIRQTPILKEIENSRAIRALRVLHRRLSLIRSKKGLGFIEASARG